MHRALTGLLQLLPLALLACSSSATDPSSPTAAPTPETKVAPSWTDAPTAFELREGLDRVYALHLGAAAGKVTVEAQAPEGVSVTVGQDSITLRSAHGVASADPVRFTLKDEKGSAVELDIPVSVARLAWVRKIAWKTGPQAREHGAFVLDAAMKNAILYDGSGYHPQWIPIKDSWRLDIAGGAWEPLQPSGDSPAIAVASARAAQKRGSATGYLYGGYSVTNKVETANGDFYRVDATTGAFTKLAQNEGPAARELHAFAYDDAGDRTVLFGGITSDMETLSDTWLGKVDGDAVTWKRIAAKPAPSARYGSFYGMDDAHRRFIVWSGAQDPYLSSVEPGVNAADDAWALDLAAEPPQWSKLAVSGEAPPGRRNGCGIFDPVGQRLFVFGGTSDAATTQKGLWVLDVTPGREAWTRLDLPNEPPVRSSGFGFADASGNVYCGFGNGSGAYQDLNVLGYR